MIYKYFLLVIFFFCFQVLRSQEKTLYTPVNFQNAIDKGTRTPVGIPGEKYWQNTSDYDMSIEYNPETRLISGTETITMFNSSPDTLRELLVHLFPNLYKKGNPRDFEIEPKDLTDGMLLKTMTVNEKIIDLSENSIMIESGNTFIWINLRSPLLPYSENNINISWSYFLNEGSHMRTGTIDDGSAFVAYFFPKIGVYDDIDGWNPYEYLGVAEFYNDFGSYDVRIKVPTKYVVWATGILQNPEQVLSNKYYLRYEEALKSDKVVHIVDSTDLKFKDITSPSLYNTFHYKATNVSDFAFGLSDHYLWDAINLKTGKEEKSQVLVSSAYNQASADFYKVIYIAQKSIEYMSDKLPGVAFPYPRMTIFNGLDEMEFPMIINDRSLELIHETFSLTYHEICHSYFPFATGCNERKYAWMDEGLTSYFENVFMVDVLKTSTNTVYLMDDYLPVIGHETDLPLFSNSESIRGEVYFNTSYSKAAMFYSVLAAQMGEIEFQKMIQGFYTVWVGKHPTGNDFLRYISNNSQDKLNWLISSWFFEYGYVDLSLSEVKREGDQLKIKVENKGKLPAQVTFKITYNNQDEEIIQSMKPDVWADGKTEIFTTLTLHGEPESVSLIFRLPMDAYPDDNLFVF